MKEKYLIKCQLSHPEVKALKDLKNKPTLPNQND
jgi:hypothetical protein